jgi:protocatechuate 3,4-dioxygenase beta subunit
MMFQLSIRPLAVLVVASLLTLSACNSSTVITPTPTAPQVTGTVAATSAPVIATPTPSSIAATLSANPTQTACSSNYPGEVDTSAILELGPGPGIPSTSSEGEMLVIAGTIYAADCTPLAGARLDVWQTDANGEYSPGHGSDSMLCCYLMGSLHTDSQGRYQLITIKPAHYKGEQLPPPAHIHVEISHSLTGQSHSEIVFAGDPYLPASLRGYVLVSLESIPATATTAAFLRGVANILVN